MPLSRKLPPIPSPEIPITDSSGAPTVEWYRWLVSFVAAIEEMWAAIP
jgi:hypothetical protein